MSPKWQLSPFLYRKPSFLCTSLPVMVQFCFLSFKLLRGCLNVITQLKCATIMHSILDDVFKAINSNDCLCVLFSNDLERVELKFSIFEGQSVCTENQLCKHTAPEVPKANESYYGDDGL